MSKDKTETQKPENQVTSFEDLMEDIQDDILEDVSAPKEKQEEISPFSENIEDKADQNLAALLAEDEAEDTQFSAQEQEKDVSSIVDELEIVSEKIEETTPKKEISIIKADSMSVPENDDPFPFIEVKEKPKKKKTKEQPEPVQKKQSVQKAAKAAIEPTKAEEVKFKPKDKEEDVVDFSSDIVSPEAENVPFEVEDLKTPEIEEPDLSLEIMDEDEPEEDEMFTGLELDIALEDEFAEEDAEELPDLDTETTAFNMDEHERRMEEKFFKDTLTLATSDLYTNVLQVLQESDDIGIDATAKARISEAQKARKLPQLICKELIDQRVITPVQLARAVSRTLRRKEITSFLNIPQEAMALRSSLDSRVCAMLREARVIPLWHRVKSEESLEGQSELHLAHESATRDLVLEAAISEYLPEHKFVWHFALRDVCGMFWLSGEEGDVDASMEAEALLDRVIGNAVDARSSDIHIDPSIKGEYKAIVRYRVDGFVQSKEVITLDQLERLSVRIQNVARMPKVDLSHPNKGAFTRAGYDWRVQIQPHAGRQGPLPRIVIRRLNPDVMGMEELGYPDYFIQYVKEAAKSPNGLVFWTGPTGSGKTESIHSAIVSANPMGRGLSVHTIEDPPEKRVPGYAVQMEIMEADPSRTAMELLKSSLRADPDVIVFGEVRDKDMAKLVFEAANTGHLVFTTLHTNTALDAIVRLDELGVNGFNLSYVRGIASQKLVRRLCSHCKQPVLKPDEYTKYVFDKYGVELQGSNLFTHDPSGCPSCNHTGYHGRIAIAEWMKPNKELVEVSEKGDYTDIESVARRSGWKPMGYMATLHVKKGITDIHEIASKVQELAGDLEG